jgi:hypothetical protein
LFEQVELKLAMFLRTQQVVDLIGINRGLNELEVHAAQYTPLAEHVNGGFLLFFTTMSARTVRERKVYEKKMKSFSNVAVARLVELSRCAAV